MSQRSKMEPFVARIRWILTLGLLHVVVVKHS